MTTFVGTQERFIDAVRSLIELDYDAIEAYDAAIHRLENANYKTQLKEFKEDHERHVRELSALLRKHRQEPPAGPSLKRVLTKGKVVVANIAGDKAILKAMLDNEEDTNQAYQTMLDRLDDWEDSKDILMRGLHDEKKHKTWIKKVV